MQHDARDVLLAAGSAVGRVPEQGMAQVFHVHADLVCASAVKRAFHE